MKRIVEQHLAEIIVLTVIILACSSCSSTGYCMQNEALYPLSKQYSCK